MNVISVRWLRQILLVLCVGMVAEVTIPEKAEARAGSGRSFGRGGGARRAPSYQRQQTPPPQNNGVNNMPQSNRGSMLRGLAGGLAGGFLGSMLFSSLGFGAGGMGGGGGMGFLEIILLGGLIYFGFRWWKSRQLATQGSGASAMHRSVNPNWASVGAPLNKAAAINSISAISAEEASDIFFRVQGAWTRRDLSSVRGILGKEVSDTLDEDLSALRRSGKINRLENISVRDVNVGEAWGDDGLDYATVRFTANLLDYTVDEKSNAVLEGSDSTPVKFEEDWTFARGLGAKWQLVGIDQIQ